VAAVPAPDPHAAGGAPGPGDAADEVVLLHDDGSPRGSAPRSGVHTASTPLHLAFSLHLIDPAGRTLITRRALSKRAWPGVWSNSCCGHPRPGEPVADAVRRRAGEELGVAIGPVEQVLPDFRYRAVDAGGVVEHEVCPVHVAVVPEDLAVLADPDEVAEHAWVPWADLHAAVMRTPMVFSPWLVLQARELGSAVPGRPTRPRRPASAS
jgi:isopentenyl-diphosphate delta-isomerase